jgi:adenylosuccinate lyase
MSDAQLLALSPLDGRYAGKVDALRPIFSEFGLIRAACVVEVEWLLALAAEPGIVELRLSPPRQRACAPWRRSSRRRCRAREGDRAHHQPRRQGGRVLDQGALADDAELGPALEFVHFACTSEDINNTSLRADAAQRAPRGAAAALDALIAAARHGARARRAADAVAHARPDGVADHGRQGDRQRRRAPGASARCIAACADAGKMNGAVGNYNAHVAAYPEVDWGVLARRFVDRSAWTSALHHQIEPHDGIAELFDASSATPSASTCAATSGATSRSATSSRR